MKQFVLSKKLENRMNVFTKQLDKAGDSVAKESRLFFRKNFNLQGFLDNTGIEKWQKRKDKRSKRRILWKSGTLRNSIGIRKVSGMNWKLSSNLAYSRIHNYGGKGLAWGKYPFTMPQRKYMGESKVLHKKMRKLIVEKLRIVNKIVG